MSAHSTYQPRNAFMKWLEARLPIGGLVYARFIVYPTPRNLNYWWTFGGILAFLRGLQRGMEVYLQLGGGSSAHSSHPPPRRRGHEDDEHLFI